MRSLALQPRPLLSPGSIGCRALAPTAYQSALSDAVLWAADPIVGDVVGPVCSALTCRLTLVATLLPMLIAAFATRSRAALPQIWRLARRHGAATAPAGRSARVLYVDALVYASRAAYHARMAYNMWCWSELLVLFLQNTACFLLCRTRRLRSLTILSLAGPEPGAGAGARPARKALGEGALLAAAAAALLWLPFGAVPARLLPLLCWWTVPLSVVSYYGQVADTRRTGQYDATLAEVRLRLIGSLVRVGTTLRFLAGDRAVLANHVVGLLGCSLILLAQREWRKTGALGRVELRKALYAQLFPQSPQQPPPPPARFPQSPPVPSSAYGAPLARSRDNWRDYRSLGGFEGRWSLRWRYVRDGGGGAAAGGTGTGGRPPKDIPCDRDPTEWGI
mmetsp:Transcript_31529/g.99121  ORF Transcript_31529/g.99121 Transcript_31529/m.99121 type:complete len:392 (-) Transcript_31529:112-1287(-)